MILIKILLIGNPNSGKSSLYNILTGESREVGNRGGVTVDIKSGKLRGKYSNKEEIVIYDIPGIYSLYDGKAEENVALNFIKNNCFDLIMNIIDATNIERALNLTYELCLLDRPVILVLNMADELKQEIDISDIEYSLGVKCVLVSCKKKTGLNLLAQLLSQKLSPPELKKKVKINYRNSPICTADRILLNRYLSLPIFIITLLLVFILSFGSFSEHLSLILDKSISRISECIYNYLESIKTNIQLISLVCDGIICGVGAVIKFIPQMTILFLCLGFIEDIGYMARISLIGERYLGRFGLGANSIVPVITSLGCTTSGVLSSRCIDNKKERRNLCTLLPILPCSARATVYATFSPFVGLNIMIYILSFTLLIIFSSKKIDETSFFILELPKYRLPGTFNILRSVKHRLGLFIKKAGSTIVIVSVAVWFLSNYNFNLKPCLVSDSLLAIISKYISPIFKPLGFGNWQSSAALLCGVGAKEGIVSTIKIIGASGTGITFSSASAVSFIIFSSMYCPCIATAKIIEKELGKLYVVKSYIQCFSIAYLCSFVTYNTMNFLKI